MESTFSRNRKLEASLAYNRKICGRSSIQTNEAACYAIAMVRVYMIQGKFVNNMCNVESLKMQGNHWEEVLKKEMESHWKMRLHVFPELSAKKTAISSAIQRRAMWQGLLWQKRKKRNWWLLPPTNPTLVPSLHALLARPHWVTKATFCGCHTAAQENTSSLFTVSPGLTHEQRSVTTPLLPVSLPCSKIDQIKSHCKVSYCLAARSLGLFLLQLNKTLDHSNRSLLHQKASEYLLWHSSRVLLWSRLYQAPTSTFSELRWWRSTLLKLGIISLGLTPDRL